MNTPPDRFETPQQNPKPKSQAKRRALHAGAAVTVSHGRRAASIRPHGTERPSIARAASGKAALITQTETLWLPTPYDKSQEG